MPRAAPCSMPCGRASEARPSWWRGATRPPRSTSTKAPATPCSSPALGLGFLLIEIALIEQAAQLLGDRTSGFALVLTAMLVFSGIGARLAGRVHNPDRALKLAVALAGLFIPGAVKAALAPLSLALGLPFPLGLDRFQQSGPAMLPWAWALNGAFSVVATPLANLMGHGIGIISLFLAGFACYMCAALAWPRRA